MTTQNEGLEEDVPGSIWGWFLGFRLVFWGVPSLKSTARPGEQAVCPKRKRDRLANTMAFRGKLAVSFREGMCYGQIY